jgi:hypothetical protein
MRSTVQLLYCSKKDFIMLVFDFDQIPLFHSEHIEEESIYIIGL